MDGAWDWGVLRRKSVILSVSICLFGGVDVS